MFYIHGGKISIHILIHVLFICYSICCFSQAGTIDSSFGTNGVVLTPFSGQPGAEAVGIQSDGKIVVAGYSFNNTSNAFVIVRYNSDGSLDPSFDDDGIVVTEVTAFDDYAEAVVIQSDGKIVVGGFSYIEGNGTEDFVVVRYNSDGELDPTFSQDGIVITDLIDNGNHYNDELYDLDIDAGGKIIAAGYSNDWLQQMEVVRYNSNGTLDNTFGTGGFVMLHFGTINASVCRSVRVQADGKIVLGGSADINFGSYYDFAIVRLNTDGSPDSSLGGYGKVRTDYLHQNNYGYSVMVEANGKITLAGITLPVGLPTFMIVRYNSDGSLDETFHSTGLANIDPGTSNGFHVSAMLQPDGKILISDKMSSDFGLLRLNQNGYIDSTFGVNGVVRVSMGSFDYPRAITLQQDGKIILAGYSDSSFALLRINSLISGGIDDIHQLENRFLIYPNPSTSGNFVCDFYLSTSATINLSLYDQAGMLIKTFYDNCFSGVGLHREQLFIDDQISSGVYILKLRSDNFELERKVVISK